MWGKLLSCLELYTPLSRSKQGGEDTVDEEGDVAALMKKLESRGVKSFLQFYILPHPFFYFYFFPHIFNAPSPLLHLIFFPITIILKGWGYFFWFSFFHVIFFPTTFILSSSLPNLKFFSNRLDKLPKGGRIGNFIHPCCRMFTCSDCGATTPSRMAYMQHVLGSCVMDPDRVDHKGEIKEKKRGRGRPPNFNSPIVTKHVIIQHQGGSVADPAL